jgi:hypothetical protein
VRISRSVLREAGGETPPAYSPVIRPSKSYSRTVSQAPRRARASELQKGFVARLDDAL